MQQPKTFFKELTTAFEDCANPDNARNQKAYMKGQFEYFGLKQAERRAIFREFLKTSSLPEYAVVDPYLHWLIEQPEREYHHCAIELLMKYKKHWGVEILEKAEYLTTHNSWWDTVDYLSVRIVGEFVIKRQNKQLELMLPWIHSNNMWLNRVAIIHQLGFKEKTNLEVLVKAILPHTASKEFFHQKAIGWTLRQYSRTDADWVLGFVNEHELKPLSKREALRLINK